MGFKYKAEKLKNSAMFSRSRIKLWTIRAVTTILLWTCVAQLMALGEMWGPSLLKGWPSCFSQSDIDLPLPDHTKLVLPPKSKFFRFPISFIIFIIGLVKKICSFSHAFLSVFTIVFLNLMSFLTVVTAQMLNIPLFEEKIVFVHLLSVFFFFSFFCFNICLIV
jgi:hypothetical protein